MISDLRRTSPCPGSWAQAGIDATAGPSTWRWATEGERRMVLVWGELQAAPAGRLSFGGRQLVLQHRCDLPWPTCMSQAARPSLSSIMHGCICIMHVFDKAHQDC